MFKGIPHLYPLGASSNTSFNPHPPPPCLWQPKMFLDIVMCPLGGGRTHTPGWEPLLMENLSDSDSFKLSRSLIKGNVCVSLLVLIHSGRSTHSPSQADMKMLPGWPSATSHNFDENALMPALIKMSSAFFFKHLLVATWSLTPVVYKGSFNPKVSPNHAR